MTAKESILERIQDFIRANNKEPVRVSLPQYLEAQLEAEWRAEKGGDLTPEEKRRSYREMFPTIDGKPVIWDADKFVLE